MPNRCSPAPEMEGMSLEESALRLRRLFRRQKRRPAVAGSPAHEESLPTRTPPPLRVTAAARLELRFLVVSRILFAFSPSQRTRSIYRHRASRPGRPVEYAVESVFIEDILGPFANEAFLPV